MRWKILPQELKDEILGFYVWNELPKKAARARIVCCRSNTSCFCITDTEYVQDEFNEYIAEALPRLCASLDLQDLWSHKDWKEYFKHTTADILCAQVLCREEETTLGFINFLRGLVDTAVERDWPLTDGVRETLRRQYARNICKAFAIIEPNHPRFLVSDWYLTELESMSSERRHAFSAAATGNVQMLLNNITTAKDILVRPSKRIPSALEIAVAANQTGMVEYILQWIPATVKGPWDGGSWKEMRAAASDLAEGLRVAIRTGNDRISNMLYQFLRGKGPLPRSLPQRAGKWLMDECVRYGNTQIYFPARHYHRNWCWPEEGVCENLDPTEVADIFTTCSQAFLQRLIKSRLFDVNNIGLNYTPLWLALEADRRDLARILLQKGAVVNGHSIHQGRAMTAARRASLRSRSTHVRLLLAWGAER